MVTLFRKRNGCGRSFGGIEMVRTAARHRRGEPHRVQSLPRDRPPIRCRRPEPRPNAEARRRSRNGGDRRGHGSLVQELPTGRDRVQPTGTTAGPERGTPPEPGTGRPPRPWPHRFNDCLRNGRRSVTGTMVDADRGTLPEPDGATAEARPA
jgi:hypothetical protein